MCLTNRVNPAGQLLEFQSLTLPYPDLVYVVGKISPTEILLIDTAHHNRWSISPEILKTCELVGDFHNNCEDVDAEFMNRALSGFYARE